MFFLIGRRAKLLVMVAWLLRQDDTSIVNTKNILTTLQYNTEDITCLLIKGYLFQRSVLCSHAPLLHCGRESRYVL
jgi:hypothetical protein